MEVITVSISKLVLIPVVKKNVVKKKMYIMQH